MRVKEWRWTQKKRILGTWASSNTLFRALFVLRYATKQRAERGEGGGDPPSPQRDDCIFETADIDRS